MTPETLSEIKSLLEKATPGPWETFKSPFGQGEYLAISNDWSRNKYKFAISQMTWNCKDEDIKLIVALRNSAPELIKAVEQRDRYRTAHEKIITEADKCGKLMEDNQPSQRDLMKISQEAIKDTKEA